MEMCSNSGVCVRKNHSLFTVCTKIPFLDNTFELGVDILPYLSPANCVKKVFFHQLTNANFA